MEGEYVSLFVGSLAIHYMHLRFSRVSSDTWTARLKVDLLRFFYRFLFQPGQVGQGRQAYNFLVFFVATLWLLAACESVRACDFSPSLPD